jgi:hypothetical protein
MLEQYKIVTLAIGQGNEMPNVGNLFDTSAEQVALMKNFRGFPMSISNLCGTKRKCFWIG